MSSYAIARVSIAALAIAAALCSRAVHAESLLEQRQRYRVAVEHLNEGRINAFEREKDRLRDYPLAPYLEFRHMVRGVRFLDAAKVRAFRARFTDSPLAERLYGVWMKELARRRDWKAYREQYEPTADIERRCTYLVALMRTGAEATAFEQTTELWRAPRSQPHACDPLFEAWIDAGRLKQALVWERLVLALDADEVALARYLEGLLVGEFKRDAAVMLRLHAHPRNLVDANVARRRSHADTIVLHTVRRLARTDAAAAAVLWRRLRPSLGVSDTQARRMAQDLTIENARAGNPDLDADLSPTPDGRHLDVAEALLHAGIGGANWPAVERWIRALDPTERAKPRWRYWLARALGTTAPLESQAEVAEIYGSLARERQYYGFLAATMIGAAPVLNERPSQPNRALITELESRPVLARVSELFAVNDPINARREWQAFDATLDLERKAAAAHLAAARGWVSQSVMAANAAKLENDLALRFPAPFRESFVASSNASSVPLGFLYAIARQESVFDPAARSLAGALGVMQMIPGTAAATARAFGRPTPRVDRLMDAHFNIDLGARHLAQLMTRFTNHRVLVAAAYNAGPQRVDRWLLARPAQPIDIWIETIPFVETRNYVKNVMAFAYIYGQMLGQPQPFLHEAEQ